MANVCDQAGSKTLVPDIIDYINNIRVIVNLLSMTSYVTSPVARG